MKMYFSLRVGLLFILVFCGSWGFLAHRTSSQLAIYQLPGSMKPFFYANRDYLVKHSVRPDLRRNEDSAEASRHFIDFEAYGDSAAWKMPHKWEQAVSIFSRDSLKKYGFVPYHVMVMKSNLERAFKLKNKDSILFYAADLAHYVGDAHVPLHTSINYDGQLTNQRGMHALWESVIPEIEINQFNLAGKHKARYLKNPEAEIWKVVQDAFQMVDNLLQQEREATKGFTDSTKYRVQMRRGREVKYYTTEFAKAYNQRLGNSINQQLIKSANMIADFWYTCWKDAGKPDLSGLLSAPLTKKELDQCKQEQHAYRQNQLISKNWLIAKQITGSGE